MAATRSRGHKTKRDITTPLIKRMPMANLIPDSLHPLCYEIMDGLGMTKLDIKDQMIASMAAFTWCQIIASMTMGIGKEGRELHAFKLSAQEIPAKQRDLVFLLKALDKTTKGEGEEGESLQTQLERLLEDDRKAN